MEFGRTAFPALVFVFALLAAPTLFGAVAAGHLTDLAAGPTPDAVLGVARVSRRQEFQLAAVEFVTLQGLGRCQVVSGVGVGGR